MDAWYCPVQVEEQFVKLGFKTTAIHTPSFPLVNEKFGFDHASTPTTLCLGGNRGSPLETPV